MWIAKEGGLEGKETHLMRKAPPFGDFASLKGAREREMRRKAAFSRNPPIPRRFRREKWSECSLLSLL